MCMECSYPPVPWGTGDWRVGTLEPLMGFDEGKSHDPIFYGVQLIACMMPRPFDWATTSSSSTRGLNMGSLPIAKKE